MVFCVINKHGNLDEKPVNNHFNCLCAALWKNFPTRLPLLSHACFLSLNSLACRFDSLLLSHWVLKSAIVIFRIWGYAQNRMGPTKPNTMLLPAEVISSPLIFWLRRDSKHKDVARISTDGLSCSVGICPGLLLSVDTAIKICLHIQTSCFFQTLLKSWNAKRNGTAQEDGNSS